MTTSVVIPSYNGKKYLLDNLPFIIKMGVDEIVIVDDASTDGSAEFITTNYPKIKLTKHKTNKRFPISVNDGFTKASGDIVFLLNQDLRPRKDLLKNTLRHFKDSNVFAVTFNENGRSWADGKWTEGGMLEFRNGKLDNQLHDSLWPSGGSSAIRRDLWNKLGGFDPIFTPGYFEDLDLGLRVHKAGYKIIWDPECRVDHLTEGTFPKSFSTKKLQYIKERNYLIAVWKNIDSKLWPAHLISLLKRVIKGPGYMIPVLWAIYEMCIVRF
ncbi:MAG: hypothetical protein A2041_06660 [Bacteroidetes bacterium GWA2_31_9b]|nr:MAG: hypothetical protein A2041_06660 [Bacteroidetes bacterium GWA2_31_9b]